jgi:hypothetical protein
VFTCSILPKIPVTLSNSDYFSWSSKT